jgi:ion channel POLLUX/CASTOR
LSARLRYAFDNFMARGTVALIGGLFVVSVLLILAISFVVALSGTLLEHDATSGIDFIELVWLSVLRTLDPGTMGGDVGSVPFVLSMLAVTLGGIFIISTLIGIISSGIEGKLADLRKGRSRVVETDHTIVLGWSGQVFAVINQLAAAYADERGHCVVVLAARDKVEMEDQIGARLVSGSQLRIVCRKGSPIDLDEIDIASPQTSRAIIVLAPDEADPDAEVIKTLLAITNAANRRPEPYHIVAELSEPRNAEVARLASRGEAQIVLPGDLIARICAQTCRQPGLSIVYSKLLDFTSDDIYFVPHMGLAGSTFGEALHAFRRACLIGVEPADGRPTLNPPMDRLIGSDEQLIVLAADRSAARLIPPPAAGPQLDQIIEPAPASHVPERTLLLGWNRLTPRLLTELDRYVPAGSILTVVADVPAATEQLAELQPRLSCQAAAVIVGDTSDRALLDRLDLASYQHVIIVAYSDLLDEQRADAKTLMTLLHLRDIASRLERPFSIVTEILDVRNRNLAQATRADDFIVSELLASQTVAQLATNRQLKPVLDDLFDADGSEIYLRPASQYVVPDAAVDFHTVVEAARRRGEVAVGYRLADAADDPAADYGIVLNPLKTAEVALGTDDRVIVLAED